MPLKLRLTVEVFECDDDVTITAPIAEGTIIGALTIPTGLPMTIKMRNLLEDVKTAIYADCVVAATEPKPE